MLVLITIHKDPQEVSYLLAEMCNLPCYRNLL